MDTSTSEGTNDEVVQKRAAIAKKLSKTRLCPQFSRNGTCPYSVCRFAHGASELSRRPDWRKTTMCRDYEQGSCTNLECNFAHGLVDLRYSLPHLQADRVTVADECAPNEAAALSLGQPAGSSREEAGASETQPAVGVLAPSSPESDSRVMRSTAEEDAQSRVAVAHSSPEADSLPDPLLLTRLKRWQ
eukprot:TRINITY_DN3938_c1_g1_i1.p1 TRINITY_DN3938_c1_g1~~TRINITY_DN3938_c1_g1_i1.p1  ORF type:complete len:188 (-),score=21.00 TRINITY_DN3938_c1_g1_i1:135-698(-)